MALRHGPCLGWALATPSLQAAPTSGERLPPARSVWLVAYSIRVGPIVGQGIELCAAPRRRCWDTARTKLDPWPLPSISHGPLEPLSCSPHSPGSERLSRSTMAHSVLGRLAICSPKYAQPGWTLTRLTVNGWPWRWGRSRGASSGSRKRARDAVAERAALEAADPPDAAVDAARAAAEDRKRRAAVRAAKERRARAVAATAAVEREIAVLDARVNAQNESAPRQKPRPPPTETPAAAPPPPGTEDYRACLAKALANATDANETLALARVYARTVTT